ncbi:hypothetical protein [Escherichia phage dw-ec]|nr:hypothetical protein [Escherichia phage BI-EHEC]UJQ43805.1 hypothetical protein [Escherichia phage dw-ec]
MFKKCPRRGSLLNSGFFEIRHIYEINIFRFRSQVVFCNRFFFSIRLVTCHVTRFFFTVGITEFQKID